MPRALIARHGVRRYSDLVTWQLAGAFKLEVYRLVRESPAASRHFKFRDQLLDSAGGPSKHIAEGFLRFSPADFCRFLDYAVSSLGEAESHVRDGLQLGHFPTGGCDAAFRLATRCTKAIMALKQSQQREAEKRRQRRRQSEVEADEAEPPIKES
jgi:four helix bundle protein